MANLCLECYNELHKTDYKPEDVWLRFIPPCARCGKWTMVVYKTEPSPYFLEAKRLGIELEKKRLQEEAQRLAEKENIK